MTSQELDRLAKDFGVVFPSWYVDALTTDYPLKDPADALEPEARVLRDENATCRAEHPWSIRGFRWEPPFWWIGGDGRGGCYFINTSDPADDGVYFIDHDDPPAAFVSDERLERIDYKRFIDDLRKTESEVERWSAEMMRKVANRKWWQFWIPRIWPQKPKHDNSQHDNSTDSK